jgi:hypothetical protein
MDRINGAEIIRWLKVGKPCDTAVAITSNEDRCVVVYFADGSGGARVKPIPIVSSATVARVEFISLPQPYRGFDRVATNIVRIGIDHES